MEKSEMRKIMKRWIDEMNDRDMESYFEYMSEGNVP